MTQKVAATSNLIRFLDMPNEQLSLDQLFIEQAEYLEDDSFNKWNASHPDEDSILRKLTQGGAKLISGPRGCGKTTLLKKAFHQMTGDSDSALPIYVNYKRSLSIEPLYKSGKSGTYWFHQWIIYKLYQGAYETLEKMGLPLELSISKAHARQSSEMLEMSNSSLVESDTVSVARLELDLLRMLDKLNRSRCVLLLDDAAHAFSPDQQRDFFDFYRQIKSKSISPKAAVYPGVTNYSSSFHVGHDAEQIDVWIKPDRNEYLGFMRRILRARFPEEAADNFSKNSAAIDFLCYAAFGVPRALLNMMQDLTEIDENGAPVLTLSKADTLRVVKKHYLNTLGLFSSLAGKLIVYKKFIETGEFILGKSYKLIKEYNKDKDESKQSVTIAIPQEDLSPEISRVFSLFQYAGLCVPKEQMVSRGEKGRFKIFTMHYAGLIDSNALIGARSINLAAYVSAFSARDAHEFTRTRAKGLLPLGSESEAFALSLPPCKACKTPRLYEDAQFCSKCGAPLTLSSTYMDLMNSDIDVLPLTKSRIEKIKIQSDIRKIKDILLDHEHIRLLQVDRIGPGWAAKIVRLAEEFVE